MNESPLSDQRIRSVFFDSSRKLGFRQRLHVFIQRDQGCFYSPAELLHEGRDLFSFPHGLSLCSKRAFFESLNALVVGHVVVRLLLLLLEVVPEGIPGFSRRVKDLSGCRGDQSSAAEPSARKCGRGRSRDPLGELPRCRHHVRIHTPRRSIRIIGAVRRCAVPSHELVRLRRRELLLLHRRYRYRHDGRRARCCPFPRVRRGYLGIHPIS